MTAEPQKKYSPEEYLELERAAEFRSDFYEGEIFPMAVTGRNHSRIKANLIGEIYCRLKGTDCRSYSTGFRVYVPATNFFAYPDFLVVCGKEELLDEEMDNLLNPKMISEIITQDTDDYDRGRKFQRYRGITSLEEYVLIDSRRLSAEVWRKNEEGFWSLMSEAYDLESSIELASIGSTVAMRDVYHQTENLSVRLH